MTLRYLRDDESRCGIVRRSLASLELRRRRSVGLSLSCCKVGAGETQLFSLLCVGVCLLFFSFSVLVVSFFGLLFCFFGFFFLLGFLSFFLSLFVCMLVFFFFPPASTSTSAQKSFVIVRVSMCALIRSFFLTIDSGNSFTLKQRCLIGLRGVYTSLGGHGKGEQVAWHD